MAFSLHSGVIISHSGVMTLDLVPSRRPFLIKCSCLSYIRSFHFEAGREWEVGGLGGWGVVGLSCAGLLGGCWVVVDVFSAGIWPQDSHVTSYHHNMLPRSSPSSSQHITTIPSGITAMLNQIAGLSHP